jgi:Fur family transcriptional regulator, ferric uptake regulator
MLYGKLPESVERCKARLFKALKGKGLPDEHMADVLVDTFLQTEEHVFAKDLQSLLKNKKMSLPLSVIEQALELLTEYGFAIELQFEGDENKRYEHLHMNHHHDHFVCMKCKKVIEFRDEKLESIQDSLIFQKGCKPLFHKLEVYGICEECNYSQKRPIPITFAKQESLVRFVKIEAKQNLKKRFAELGFIEGEQIRIVKNSHFGPLILEVRGSRLAIGRGQAQHILVREK